MPYGWHDALDNQICKSIDFGQGDGSNSNLDLNIATQTVGGTILNSAYTRQSYLTHKVINEIKFSKGKINFITSERIDNSMMKLDQIIVENLQHNQIKKIIFNYDYFDSENINSALNTYNFSPFGVINQNFYKKD